MSRHHGFAFKVYLARGREQTFRVSQAFSEGDFSIFFHHRLDVLRHLSNHGKNATTEVQRHFAFELFAAIPCTERERDL